MDTFIVVCTDHGRVVLSGPTTECPAPHWTQDERRAQVWATAAAANRAAAEMTAKMRGCSAMVERRVSVSGELAEPAPMLVAAE